jgi:hypothetical protein
MIGIVARRRLVPGLVGLIAFGALGAVAAVTRPANGWITAVPSVAGCAAGMVALTLLVRAMARAGLATDPGSLSGTGGAVASGGTGGRGGTGPSDEIANRDEPKDGPSSADRRNLLLTGAGALAVAGAGGLGGRLLLARPDRYREPRPYRPAHRSASPA